MAGYWTLQSLFGRKLSRAKSSRNAVRGNAVQGRPGVPFGEKVFQSILTLERRRAERAGRAFVLVLVHSARNDPNRRHLEDALAALISNTRESDLVGWYRESVTLGVLFTEIGEGEKAATATALLQKMERALATGLGEENASKLEVSAHVFPEDWDGENSSWVSDSKLYPELRSKTVRKHVHLGLKRALDVTCSTAILLVMFPILAVIAAIIKLTSKGPVLFQQERLGQFGARFKCLKFRTMYTNSDPGIHREYVRRFIAGNAESSGTADSQKPLYKLAGDRRITPIGRILRKTSLDEFPQFWNVLRGEMSLVGPRPPLAYEFEVYDVWHRRRVLEMKPGITGPWQIGGRNRIRFEEMVRLDLSYAQRWSLWLDIKILLATPWALLVGDCA
jgi:lipopolysaccharide/colanic/teichoic acid biosynthesis glycosyltransferase